MASEVKPPPSEMIMRMAEKKHRPSYEIQKDLDEAFAKFKAIQTENDTYQGRRNRSIVRVETLAKAWKKDNPGEPFDPEAYNPPAKILHADSPIQRDFHRQHSVINNLQAELEAAKKAEIGE